MGLATTCRPAVPRSIRTPRQQVQLRLPHRRAAAGSFRRSSSAACAGKPLWPATIWCRRHLPAPSPNPKPYPPLTFPISDTSTRYPVTGAALTLRSNVIGGALCQALFLSALVPTQCQDLGTESAKAISNVCACWRLRYGMGPSCMCATGRKSAWFQVGCWRTDLLCCLTAVIPIALLGINGSSPACERGLQTQQIAPLLKQQIPAVHHTSSPFPSYALVIVRSSTFSVIRRLSSGRVWKTHPHRPVPRPWFLLPCIGGSCSRVEGFLLFVHEGFLLFVHEGVLLLCRCPAATASAGTASPAGSSPARGSPPVPPAGPPSPPARAGHTRRGRRHP